jgi:uncharacterized coiled-coil protein SlyX
MGLRMAPLLAAVVFVIFPACRDGVDRTASLAVAAEETAAEDGRRAEEERAAAERLRWMNELGALEKQQAVLGQELDERKRALAESESQLRERKQDLRRQKAETDTYIGQHELQVACAFADEAARNESGEYSEKTKECAKTVSMYCALPMLMPSFRHKVEQTRRHIDDAEARAQSLKAGIAKQEKTIEARRNELQATQAALDRMASEVAALRQKLGAADE